jgi:hypothetical protein
MTVPSSKVGVVCVSRLCGLDIDESTVTENRTRLDSGRFHPVVPKVADDASKPVRRNLGAASYRGIPGSVAIAGDRLYYGTGQGLPIMQLWPFFRFGFRVLLDQKFSERFAKSNSTTTMSLPCCADSALRAWLIRLSVGAIPMCFNKL